MTCHSSSISDCGFFACIILDKRQKIVCSCPFIRERKEFDIPDISLYIGFFLSLADLSILSGSLGVMCVLNLRNSQSLPQRLDCIWPITA